eukprot:8526757-Alexandrium_andersonii.AAC.1
MSASLVGSEMCIRDSRCMFVRMLACAVVAVAVAVAAVVVVVVVACTCTCLLYTSDAADDM